MVLDVSSAGRGSEIAPNLERFHPDRKEMPRPMCVPLLLTRRFHERKRMQPLLDSLTRNSRVAKVSLKIAYTDSTCTYIMKSPSLFGQARVETAISRKRTNNILTIVSHILSNEPRQIAALNCGQKDKWALIHWRAVRIHVRSHTPVIALTDVKMLLGCRWSTDPESFFSVLNAPMRHVGVSPTFEVLQVL